jgi:hypothetical protein
MTISIPYRRGHALRIKSSRDWPLMGAAVAALVSFIMLFPPWLKSAAQSENAFGEDQQTAGPALIVVMAFATIVLVAAAIAATDRRYLLAALLTSSNLLVLYLVKVVDVSDLADLYSRLSSPAVGVAVTTGAGVWLGFVFALLTFLLLLAALGLRWGLGDTLTYPTYPADGTPPRAPDPPPAPAPQDKPGERPGG